MYSWSDLDSFRGRSCRATGLDFRLCLVSPFKDILQAVFIYLAGFRVTQNFMWDKGATLGVEYNGKAAVEIRGTSEDGEGRRVYVLREAARPGPRGA